MEKKEPILLTTSEVSRLYAVSSSVICRAIQAGEIPAWKIKGRGRSGKWRMKRAEVERWIFGVKSQAA